MSRRPAAAASSRRLLPILAALSLATAAAAPIAGCGRGGYGNDRPPADQLDRRDRGLQSYDVITAADRMAQSLLSMPEINASPQRLTVVVDRALNNTATYPGELQIFLDQLKVELNQRGRDRIQLIANRDEYRDLQSRELEQPMDNEREFGGAGSVGPPPGGVGIQPDFILRTKVNDLPGRGTNFYQFNFELTDLNQRALLWTDNYTVRVAR